MGKGAMGGRGGGRQAACLPMFLSYHSLGQLGPPERDLGERRGREEWERREREVRRGGTEKRRSWKEFCPLCNK